MEKLVFQYLTHNGFCETAAVMARDALADTVQVSAVDSEEVQRREEVSTYLLSTFHCPLLSSGSLIVLDPL